MTLEEYLENKSAPEFARAIGVAHVTVWRYLRNERTPTQAVMRKIYDQTKGQVTPNDFLRPDLPVTNKSQVEQCQGIGG